VLPPTRWSVRRISEPDTRRSKRTTPERCEAADASREPRFLVVAIDEHVPADEEQEIERSIPPRPVRDVLVVDTRKSSATR
jgi:hypothetical protein